MSPNIRSVECVNLAIAYAHAAMNTVAEVVRSILPGAGIVLLSHSALPVECSKLRGVGICNGWDFSRNFSKMGTTALLGIEYA